MVTTPDVSDLVTLVVGQAVLITAGYTTSTDKVIFRGFIEEFSPEAGQIKFVCKDKMWDLIRRNVNRIYEDTGPQAGQISAIAQDLIETFGGLTASVQATGTGVGETIAEFRCPNTDIWERLVALAQAVNYKIWYDPILDVVNFRQGGFNDSGVTLTVGTQILDVPTWTNDTSKMVNDLRVDGAVSETQLRFPLSGAGQINTTTDFDTDGIILTKTPESVELIIDASNPPTAVVEGGTKDASTTEFYYVDKQNKTIKPATGTSFTVGHFAIVNYTWLAPSPIHQVNQGSKDTYGIWAKQVTLGDIRSLADGEARTSEILRKFSVPFLIGEFMVDNTTDPGIELGDKVFVVDSVNSPSISQEFVITKQILKYPATSQGIIVGDESLKLADWQLDVETRLKRIEELLSLQNQDLILEVVDIENQIVVEPRYRQVLDRDVTNDNFWAGGNWGTQSWQDDYINDQTDHFIQQFEDEYTEEFIDEIFKDAATTAIWTGNGEMIL